MIRRCLVSLLFLLLVSSCAGIDERSSGNSAPTGERILIMMKEARAMHYRPGQDFSADYSRTRGTARRAAEAVADEHGVRLVDEYPMPGVQPKR